MPDERESTQAIARRLLEDYPEDEGGVEAFVGLLTKAARGEAHWYWNDMQEADLAELLRRAAAGECDP